MKLDLTAAAAAAIDPGRLRGAARSFDRFAELCSAAQVPEGPGRVSLFMALPEDVRHDLWRDLDASLVAAGIGS